MNTYTHTHGSNVYISLKNCMLEEKKSEHTHTQRDLGRVVVRPALCGRFRDNGVVVRRGM